MSTLNVTNECPRTLSYSDGLRKDLKLLEVDEDLLKELQQDGLFFKGSLNEEAVLCSSSKTYAVKNVETTNLVLLVDPKTQPPSPSVPCPAAPSPPLLGTGLATQINKNSAAEYHAPVTVSAIVGSHLELVHIAPRFTALDRILSLSALSGLPGLEQNEGGQHDQANGTIHTDDMDTDSSCPNNAKKGLTFDQLLGAVQASALELSHALEQRGAVCIKNRYRGVTPEYLHTLLELILLTAVEEGWKLEAIPVADAIEAMKIHDYASEIVEHCLRTYSIAHKGKEGNGEQIGHEVSHGTTHVEGRMDRNTSMPAHVTLDSRLVIKAFGLQLLREKPEWESIEAFTTSWMQKLPNIDGLVPQKEDEYFQSGLSLDLLQGHVLKDISTTTLPGSSNPTSVTTTLRYFSKEDLPREQEGRFAALFSARARWELKDLEPYIEGLAGPGETMEVLLLKYARMSQTKPTEPVLYSSRF